MGLPLATVACAQGVACAAAALGAAWGHGKHIQTKCFYLLVQCGRCFGGTGSKGVSIDSVPRAGHGHCCAAAHACNNCASSSSISGVCMQACTMSSQAQRNIELMHAAAWVWKCQSAGGAGQPKGFWQLCRMAAVLH